ncbi:MAG: VanZ family protein [Paludibacteraceae bacterium]|nr:VanZ family protein [Paludibacteraceae bacterium]
MKKILLSPFVAASIFYFSTIKKMPEALSINSAHDIVYSESGEQLFTLTFFRDTIGHFFFYALFAFTLFFDLRRCWSKMSPQKQNCITLAIPIGFGIFMEFVQKYLFPPRAFEWSDIMANSFGCILGFLIARYYNKRKAKKSIQ